MTDDFEDHCWKDVITPDVLEVYSCYRRKVFVGPSPALLAVDLYDVVYRGGPRPPAELAKTHPNTCGEYAYAAIEPTKRLFAAARAAGLPIFYSTGDVRAESRPSLVTATKRNKPPVDAADYAISAGVQAAAAGRRHHQAARERLLRHAADCASHPARGADADHLRREHLGLRARDRGRRLFPRLPRRAGGGVLLRSQRALAQGQTVRHASQIRGRDACRPSRRASRRHGGQEGELMRA